jgi:valyl-tRNA synthetase
MQPLPKDYKFTEIEAKWQKQWEEMGIYHYDWNDQVRQPFSIDTPPPYPSGELHNGAGGEIHYDDERRHLKAWCKH